MKRCPNCNLEYSDDTLEFCLEDGTRLVLAQSQYTETATIARPNTTNPHTERTVNLPFSKPAETIEFREPNQVSKSPQTSLINEDVAHQNNKIFEIAPFAISLAHNWWQWIYLNNQYYSSFWSYILSANFLMWLLLLAVGAAGGLLAMKRCRDKKFAIASLVIISINLILFLVPKR